ncbi:carbamoyl phosphate synthase small subunit [Anaerocolumna sp.]|uniref:carbamoyl phosphate synthase small subunit n=1 Tax=Anaerocolumna sp. TaxID=2041569 RepID=UPI0028A86F07|nr:carbamoyl phosphate synthase small subunit [Anaerocolumna sp.]
MKAFLILEDGTVFVGKSIGATGEIISEIVFNTSMTGYLEILTDPSYAGQAVVMTYPLIGNYGICYEDMESAKSWVGGYIVKEIARRPSNFRSEGSIEKFLIEKNIPGIEGIDTRALTKILREKGTMNGMITTNENFNRLEIIEKLKNHHSTNTMNIVTCKEKENLLSKDYKTTEAEQARSGLKVNPYKTGKFSIALLDLGSKKNIADCLLKRGCDVTVYPAFTKAEDIIKDNPDGIILSNGPGDPKEYVDIIKEVKKLYDSNIPIFAICLGHQLMALANGGNTRKMKYGHRGANHPVKDLKTGRVYISTQNHGYVVEGESLSGSIVEPSFINVNDRTIEGLHYLGKNIFTVQFHPEACSGPQDTEFLFDEFIQMMEVSK